MTSRYANVSEVPLALAVFLASDFYDHDDDPNTISATALLKPIRQSILSTRVPPGDGMVNLADMMSSRIGTAIHDGIERSWRENYRPAMQALGYPERVINMVKINPKDDEIGDGVIPVYMEERLSRFHSGFKITGKFDFIAEGEVQDFKSTSTFTYRNQVNATKYALQGSIYRWLDPKKITKDTMKIHYIFTDWKPSMVKSDPDYPPRRFHTQTFNLLSLQETDEFIRNKLKQLMQFKDAHEDDIPECGDEDLWRSEPQFKYYKNPNKTARSTKNFDTYQEALIRLSEDGNVGKVVQVPGQVTACKYCSAFAACSQKDRLVASGDLIL